MCSRLLSFLEKIKQNPAFKNLFFDPFKILSQTHKMVETLHKYSAFKPQISLTKSFKMSRPTGRYLTCSGKWLKVHRFAQGQSGRQEGGGYQTAPPVINGQINQTKIKLLTILLVVQPVTLWHCHFCLLICTLICTLQRLVLNIWSEMLHYTLIQR